jgi:hypothetical protein
MTKAQTLGNVFQEFGKEMRNHFINTLAYVDHPLELGLARERLLVDYLERLVPERFKISTGFVIDSKGNRSRQMDVVIYDKIVASPFELPGHLNFFPCECVVAVGEVKSTINSVAMMDDALAKIKSVQQLDRFSGFTNLDVACHGCHGHAKIEIKEGLVPIKYRILGFIFTSSALSTDTMIEQLKLYFSQNPPNVWPNIVTSFDQYLISYAKGTTLEMFPDGANEVYATTPEEIDRIIPTFGALVAHFLSVVRVVRPLLLDYLSLSQSHVRRFPIH